MVTGERIGMNKKYIVRLTPEERQELHELIKKGKAPAYRIKHANILLAVDLDGPMAWPDEKAAQAFHCVISTVAEIRQRLVMQGLAAALTRKPHAQPPRKPILDGAQEARLTALACSKPAAGRAKWTLHLLADKLVELKIVDSISHETVRKILKKTNCNHIAMKIG